MRQGPLLLKLKGKSSFLVIAVIRDDGNGGESVPSGDPTHQEADHTLREVLSSAHGVPPLDSLVLAFRQLLPQLGHVCLGP